MAGNPLVEPASPESSPQVRVHPTVLLAQNDHATRSTIRHQGGIIGAVLGSTTGQHVTMDLAFECGSGNMTLEDGVPALSRPWFLAMLKLYGETYPELSLVGWYTFGDEPLPWHMHFQTRFKKEFECPHALFMLRHHSEPEEQDGLPFVAYESSAPEAGSMEVDSPEMLAASFRETFVSLETTADEAIVLADIVQLATNAQPSSVPVSADTKGKGKAEDDAEPNYLTAEEEELIQSLKAKAASISTLKSRLQIIIDYLHSQNPSYLTDASIPVSTDVLDHKVLRSIYALAAQMHLTAPSEVSEMSLESARTQTNVELIGLLSSLTRSVADIRTLGLRQNMMDTHKGGNFPPGAAFSTSGLFSQDMNFEAGEFDQGFA